MCDHLIQKKSAMKTILFIFLYIASCQCGVLKEDLDVAGSDRYESKLIRVNDYFNYAGITFIEDRIIDVTKNKEPQPTNLETKTFDLSSGTHTWEVKFLVTEQPAEEINRILSIVEATATKNGQLIDKNCTTRETDVICHFNINVEATKPSESKIHKREVKDAPSTDIDEINRLIKLAEDAENKDGETDGKNCRTVDGAVICNVYIPEDSLKAKHKRDIEVENETSSTEEDQMKEILEILDAAGEKVNCTMVTAENEIICGLAEITANECPTGKVRADDGTCVPEVW